MLNPKFKEVQSSGDDTHTVLNDILDLDGERKMQNLDIKSDILVIYQMMIY